MPPVTCSRCFKIFDGPEGRAGAAPVCPDCAAKVRAFVVPRAGAEPATAPGSRGRAAVWIGLAAAVVVALAGLAWARWPRGAGPTASPRGPVEDRIQAWRDARLLPPAPPRGAAAAHARARAAAGREALRADLPARARAALEAFREALAAEPGLPEAAAGFAEAAADLQSEDSDAEELRAAHEFLDLDTESGPGRPALAAARARLLLMVESEANAGQALAAASAAALASPGDAPSALAHGLALVRRNPAAAATVLEQSFRKDPGDRRLLTAAALAHRAAGDPVRALALAAERLRLDPGQPAALQLSAEIHAAAGHWREARTHLERWRAANRESPVPALLLARLAYQVDGDLAAARRLLAEALPLAKGDFAASRVLAHRAAVERLGGDEAAARATAAMAVARVPGGAPGRFQSALLAWRAGDLALLRESAGVLGERAGPEVAQLVAARVAELSGAEDAAEAWHVAAARFAVEPAVLFGVAGGLARRGAPGLALDAARKALFRDPLEARLERAPSDFHEGPDGTADACGRLEVIARSERAVAATALAAAAACELTLSRGQHAERLARASAALAPQAAAPQWIRAQVALDRGKPRVALPLANAAVEADARSAVAREVRARALEALGRSAEAARDREEALRLLPDLATARLARARALARDGQAGEARAAVEALAAERPELTGPRALLLELPGAGRPASL